MSGGYVPEVRALIDRIEPIVPKVRLPYPRWIVTPDGDLGSEWCSDCGYYKIRNLRRRDRKRAEDYILDGGWRTEEDRFCFCAGCGTRLDVCPTTYCVEETVWHFRELGISTNPGSDAYEIYECLHAVEYRSDDDKDADLRAAVITVAIQFLSETATLANDPVQS